MLRHSANLEFKPFSNGLNLISSFQFRPLSQASMLNPLQNLSEFHNSHSVTLLTHLTKFFICFRLLLRHELHLFSCII